MTPLTLKRLAVYSVGLIGSVLVLNGCATAEPSSCVVEKPNRYAPYIGDTAGNYENFPMKAPADILTEGNMATGAYMMAQRMAIRKKEQSRVEHYKYLEEHPEQAAGQVAAEESCVE
jgi:hypothetical protein